MNKITGKLDYSKVNFKQFYLDGLNLKAQCPECNKNISTFLDGIYPVEVKPDGRCKIKLGCPECGAAMSISTVLQISFKF